MGSPLGWLFTWLGWPWRARLWRAVRLGDEADVRRVLGGWMGRAQVHATVRLNLDLLRRGLRGSVLQHACVFGTARIAHILVEAGAPLDHPAHVRHPLLCCVAGRQHPDSLNLTDALIEWGVDVQARDEEGWTALALAVVGGQVAIAKRLLRAGADPNPPTQCLWVAADGFTEETPIVRLLGTTVLHVALKNNDLEMVEALLESGADPRVSVAVDVSRSMAVVDHLDCAWIRDSRFGSMLRHAAARLDARDERARLTQAVHTATPKSPLDEIGVADDLVPLRL